MKKNITILSALLFCSAMVFGQVKVHVGASTTVNATFLLDEGLKTDPQYVQVTSYDMAPIGMNFGLDFTNSFGIQIESILSFYNQAYEIYELTKTTKIGDLNFDMQYIHLPMLLKFMSGNDNKARMHFLVGPQLSFLMQGRETLTLYQEAQGEILAVPDVGDYQGGDELPAGTVQLADGDFQLPATLDGTFSSDLLTKNAQDQIDNFKNQEVHIVAGFGLDIDLTKDLYLSALVKADYGFTDMRNGDLINDIKTSGLTAVEGLYGKRASLAIGAQITVSYMFGGTRSFVGLLR